jgi:surface protein
MSSFCNQCYSFTRNVSNWDTGNVQSSGSAFAVGGIASDVSKQPTF